MIEKMEKIFIYGLSEDSSRMVSDLMESGCLQVVHPETLAGFEEIGEEMAQHAVGLYDSEQQLSRLGAAISVLSPYFPKKKLLDKRPGVGFGQLAQKSVLPRALELCSTIEDIQQDIARYKADQSKTEFLKTSLEPWKDFDLPLEVSHTRDCEIWLLIFSAGDSTEELQKAVEEKKLLATLTEVSRDTDQLYVAAVCHKSHSTELWDLLRQEGAVKASFKQLTGTAVQNINKTNLALKELKKSIDAAEDKLRDAAANGMILKEAYDSVQLDLECSKAKSHMLHTEAAYLLTAWVPQRRKPKVEKVLEKYSCYYEFHQPEKSEVPPVLLKNNKLVEPFEAITEMYSLPAYESIDPDPFMAPFFFLFFGMMLSDAGYGLLLMVVGLLGAKFTGSKLMKMLGYCGLSTIFWGALYGSWFGDAIPQFANTFLGLQINVPALIDPLKDPITVLILSFAFGTIHLFVGMGLKAYLIVRSGHPWQAFFDVGLWYFVLVGLVMLLLGGVPAEIGKWMAIGGAVGLVLTQGRDKKNIIMKFLSGLLSLYDITGYFSDVLSYSRIMALGLATGVIASVINTMGTMPGGNIIGFIVFILVFVFGHILNFGINALGSYVHTSRLQYVEFFGKFFEGGGQKFRPLKANTKYYSINTQEAGK